MREVDRLGRRVPSRIGGAAVWFEAVPGLASQFGKTVPASHLLRPKTDLTVRCPCGGETPLEGRGGSIVACAGGCDRFFLLAKHPTEVFVAGPYADEAELAA